MRRRKREKGSIMRERELEVAGGSLCYGIEDGKVRITDFRGAGPGVVIPDTIDGYPVTGIGKKAFLSKKRLRRVVLPREVREVGDWAFACCDGLREVCLPGKEIRFGKAVFLECGSLRRIAKLDAGQDAEFQPELLAAAVKDFGAYYLLDIPAVGSREWLEKWDVRLSAALHASDQEGYSGQALCGEEDYGGADPEAYASGRRREKVRLALLRLLFPQGLPPALREELRQYLLEHTGGRAEDEAWQVILQEHGEDRAYYGLFAQIGCVTAENLDGILTDIGENFPEMKAFFLRGRQSGPGGNFLESLEW